MNAEVVTVRRRSIQLWVAVAGTILIGASPCLTSSVKTPTLLFIATDLAAPLAYVALLVRVYRASNRSRHTWWLLLLIVCLWRPLEGYVMLLLWTLKGGP